MEAAFSHEAIADAAEQLLDRHFKPMLIQYLSTLRVFGNPNDLLTQTEAARIKKCSRKAIADAIKRGDLPCYTRHRMVFYDDLKSLKMRQRNKSQRPKTGRIIILDPGMRDNS
jgi:hypothetical protein